jgi:alkanesulfonate monooxygenase SsuD/methylene tetrahydromethanopterin reductase-like flavin-dependent oxidoreductase (luciferase family)
LAAVTSRIELGPLVTSTSYRNPALIAKIAETVDEISGGRLVLGLGAGHVPFEATAFGFPYDRRASRFEEAIQIITGLLHERTVSFDGTFYQARDCELRPAGPRPGGLPVMAGVEGLRMMRLAARHADEINIDIGTTLDTVGPTRDAIDAACRDVGRDPATLRRSAFVLVDLSSDDLPGDPWVAGIFEGRAYIGPPEQLVRVFRAYAAAGFGHVQVWLNPTSVEAINALAPVLGLLHGALSEEGASPALQRGETPHDRSGPAQA